jgi:hypothetical protein
MTELRELNTQVKKYGPVPAGKYRKSMETWKKYSSWKAPDFFHWLLASFLFFPPGNTRKSPKKIRKFTGCNTASMFHHFPEVFCRVQSLFRPFPSGSSQSPVIF